MAHPVTYPPIDITALPVPVGAVKCGLRADLPRKQRRHDYRYAGLDVLHLTDGSYTDCHVAICVRCGVEHRSDKGVPGGN